MALDALMRERGGVWIAHGAGAADRAVVDAGDKVRVPPDHPSYELRRLWLDEPTFSRVLRRLRQRRSVAAVPSGRRPPAVPQRGLGRLPGRQRPVRRRHRRGARRIETRRCSSRTTTWRSWRHALRARRPAARTALFWHIPWPYPDRLRICPVAPRDARRACSPTTCSRFSSSAIAATSCWPSRTSSTPRSRPKRRACGSAAASTTVVAVPIGVDYDRIQAHRRRPGARRRAAAAAPSCSISRRHRRHRRRPARLHERHPRAAGRARPRS